MLELLHKALFAFISGFSELFLVSTSGNQLIYRTLSGYDLSDNLLFLGIHLGCLVALMMNCHQRIRYLKNQKRLERPGKRRRGRQPDLASLSDVRILNTAVWPVLLGAIFCRKAQLWGGGLFQTVLFLVINGIVLYLPRLLRSGNKDARSITLFDGLMIGFGGALGAIPGFSRLGCMYSIGLSCGSDKNYALDLSILLTIPAMVASFLVDLFWCTAGLGSLTGLQLLGAVVAFVTAFAGTRLAIATVRFVCDRSNTVVFAYYSWGSAMFLLLIYLFVS